ncbi:phytoene desaturase [Bacillus sp. FJAT-42376]|uniref:phytoene desaturase family protein n=1 Tax=Bacillus sp. FJAT-42376 TaxID=2014076 RepID=UPI000F51601C|nr:phytoene desaturase family protein [Bacillus sp. FJAT-42376]AZB42300.1 phytoene desaturase [Bacillus sp. FJAT-42376]
MKKAVVVGAGLGGLSAAITLASKGWDVTVAEKNSHSGGKLMPVMLGSYQFDFGPNTITMPQVFEQVFRHARKKMEDFLEMVKLEQHTVNYFPDGTRFFLSSDKEAMKRQLKDLDPKGHKNYGRFLEEISRLYRLSEAHFFPRMFKSVMDYASPSLSYAFMRVRPLETMDHFFRKYFGNEQVIQAFNRYATYIGSSPYQSPATFAMIAYLELVQGVYYVKGGNTKIAESFYKIAQEMGVQFIMNTKVQELQVSNKRINTVLLENGQELTADEVILNADLLKAFPELVAESDRPHFTDKKRNGYAPSISAFVITAGAEGKFDQLGHHNVFFSNDYRSEFDELFKRQAYSSDPTIYISNSAYTDPSQAPDGSNLFILVNAPPLTEDGRLQVSPQSYKAIIYKKLEDHGLSLTGRIREERIFTPLDIQDTFGAYRGALYGISANKKWDAFMRPSNFPADIQNLSFAGGSTHPGGGSPMVTISGMNVAEEIARRSK